MGHGLLLPTDIAIVKIALAIATYIGFHVYYSLSLYVYFFQVFNSHASLNYILLIIEYTFFQGSLLTAKGMHSPQAVVLCKRLQSIV